MIHNPDPSGDLPEHQALARAKARGLDALLEGARRSLRVAIIVGVVLTLANLAEIVNSILRVRALEHRVDDHELRIQRIERNHP